MSATEIMILLIVGIVVVGPKRLPTMMRTAGKWISKMRRMSSDLRSQSGIDRIIREEGLEKEIRELRSLKESLSKQALLDSLVKAADSANAPIRPKLPARPAPAVTPAVKPAELAAQKADDPPGEQTKVAETTEDAGKSVDVGSAAAVAAVSAGAASALYKPAEGTVARTPGLTRSAFTTRPVLALPSPARAPYRSMREREFPACGPDHYDALPDDLAEDEEDVRAEEHAASSAQEAQADRPEERVESIA